MRFPGRVRHTVCRLKEGLSESLPLELLLDQQQHIVFHVRGNSAVHLSGQILLEDSEADDFNVITTTEHYPACLRFASFYTKQGSQKVVGFHDSV